MGKINWDEETSRKLLTILLDEKEKGRNKTNWDSIAKNLNARTNGDATAKQVQNHASNLRVQFKTYEELSRFTGISFHPVTGAVDIQELGTERWAAFVEKNKKYGPIIARKGLANKELLEKVFGGTTAHGVGGCFSSIMAKGTSYLSKNMNNLLINEEQECEGESDDKVPSIDLNLSSGAAESISPPNSRPREVKTTQRKRKSEATIESTELKRRQCSFDSVIQLLSSNAGTSSKVTRGVLVNEALNKLDVAGKKGDAYFIDAMVFLEDEKRADSFLSLGTDNQKWIYLSRMENI